jgi:hypothetical protein
MRINHGSPPNDVYTISGLPTPHESINDSTTRGVAENLPVPLLFGGSIVSLDGHGKDFVKTYLGNKKYRKGTME